MAHIRLRELYAAFDEGLDYLVDLLLDDEITADELRRQATAEGYSEHDIGRALAFAGVQP